MLLSFVGFLFSCTCMLGANYVVQVGEKIQDKVAGASSGDAVIIRGGTFPEQAVTITQPMRLVREKGQRAWSSPTSGYTRLLSLSRPGNETKTSSKPLSAAVDLRARCYNTREYQQSPCTAPAHSPCRSPTCPFLDPLFSSQDERQGE